jgi:hypothetical protein
LLNSEFNDPSEHLGVDLLIIFFKEVKVSELKFANSATLMATHDMEVYLGKDGKRAISDMTATHVAVKQLTRKVEGA